MPAASNSAVSAAVAKTHVGPGELDEYYVFFSSGQSGELRIYGLPSMRELMRVPVFNYDGATGWGLTNESRKILTEGLTPETRKELNAFFSDFAGANMKSFDQATQELVDYLFNFVQLTRRQRVELRNRVERLSEMFDWSALSRHYKEAHDLALGRKGIARPGSIEVRLL